jgi:hypothetical protein
MQLPVYPVRSKSEAEAELASAGLSSASLEQKCLRQIANESLDPDTLRKAIDQWGAALRVALRDPGANLTLLASEVFT